MKKIAFYILLIILFGSCQNMLDEVPKDFVSRANYFQSEADAQGAINGAYSSLTPDYYGGITYYLMVALQGDYLNGRGSQAPVSDMSKVLDQQNINRAGSSWSALYQAIDRANSILDNVPNITDISPDVQTTILAEAHFLRAMAYFELVRGWGAVPLKTKESTDLSDLDVPRSPVGDVYDLIVSDAKVAEAGLPESVGTETGKASKWAAKMLLAHVYLTTGDWADAAKEADDVINSGMYSLVTVRKPDDFYQIFGSETSSEDIMSVHYSENITSTIPIYLHRGGDYPYNYGSTGYYAWVPDTAGNSIIGKSWNNNDLRKKFNLYREIQDADGNWVSLPSTTPVLFKKFITNKDGLSIYSVPIYRYAEAFLFYAEASCRADGGPSALALERLNMIKRRAYGYDPGSPSPVDYAAGTTETQFVDSVMQERAYEFLLERRRWFDLKRTGKVKEAFAAVGKTVIDARMLWPIPENEINNNSAINQADQNPGY